MENLSVVTSDALRVMPGVRWLSQDESRMKLMKRHTFFSSARRRSLFVLLILAAPGTVVWAELPPYVYKERQQKAPESLVIKVRSVKTRETDETHRRRIDVDVEAQVEQVVRSNTGLRVGDAIHISYVHSQHKEPIAGPSEVPILDEGEKYPAYLSRDEKEKRYVPAAGGYSFREVE
jgi:hypothetical protein